MSELEPRETIVTHICDGCGIQLDFSWYNVKAWDDYPHGDFAQRCSGHLRRVGDRQEKPECVFSITV